MRDKIACNQTVRIEVVSIFFVLLVRFNVRPLHHLLFRDESFIIRCVVKGMGCGGGRFHQVRVRGGGSGYILHDSPKILRPPPPGFTTIFLPQHTHTYTHARTHAQRERERSGKIG